MQAADQDRTLTPRELATGGNRMLAALGDDDLRRLAGDARRERFGRGEVLAAADQPASAAFFIEDGVASVVKPHGCGRRTELCLIGPDGFTGTAIVTSDGQWPYETFVQVDRLSAVRVEAAELRALFEGSGAFRRLVMTAIHLQTVQIAEGLVSAAWQRVNERLARWLLMFRDRSRSDVLDVTHEFIALMVGAQRTKITAALHELEDAGGISASRGRVVIRDAAVLAALADGSYGRVEVERARLAEERRLFSGRD